MLMNFSFHSMAVEHFEENRKLKKKMVFKPKRKW